MSESTYVQFPRFQFETPSGGPLHDRKLIERAMPKQWLSDDQLEIVSKHTVDTNPDTKSKNIKGNWFGLWHHAKESISVGQLFDLPFEDGPSQLYRSRVLEHTYCWSDQATDGKAHEIILERIDFAQGNFTELLGVLIQRKQYTGAAATQKLVMKGEEDNWYEPEFGRQNDKKSYYLGIVGQLAVQEVLPENVIPITLGGNRKAV